jgi:hypothetical protein
MIAKTTLKKLVTMGLGIASLYVAYRIILIVQEFFSKGTSSQSPLDLLIILIWIAVGARLVKILE